MPPPNPANPAPNLAPPPPLDTLMIDGTIALFLDFDGTLVAIADAPDAIVVGDGLAQKLTMLADRMGGRVALISGRGVVDLDAHLGSDRLVARRFAWRGSPRARWIADGRSAATDRRRNLAGAGAAGAASRCAAGAKGARCCHPLSRRSRCRRRDRGGGREDRCRCRSRTEARQMRGSSWSAPARAKRERSMRSWRAHHSPGPGRSSWATT